MKNYWITTHWPSQEPVDSPARNVFFKVGKRRQFPKPGDGALIYESAHAVVDGKRVFEVERCHRGLREREILPLGRSAIISKVAVAGEPRKIQSDDIVRDYGNLSDWLIIPCEQQMRVRELPKQDLMALLGYPRETPPRFLTLYRIPEMEQVQRILMRLATD